MITLGHFSLKRDGELLVDEGDIDDRIYICLEGKINDYDVGFIINEEEACEDATDTFTCKKKLVKAEAGYIFWINLKIIQKEKKIKMKSGNTLKNLSSKNELVRGKSDSITSKYELKDLYVLCKLGEGQMGKVYLV